MQSVPITTNVVNSNPLGEMYSIQHYVIKFVSDLRMSLVFSCYFGFNFSNNIIYNITKKANAISFFLRRNINSCSRQVKAQCYTTLIRPNLEYAANVWDPYTKFNINKLKKCQRRAARFVIGVYSRESSVTSMLKELKWPTLQQRRTNAKW